MRLTCPNCAAQYEVDGRVIPETGRDVQCSNCGHAWFQPPEGEVADAGGPAPVPAPVSEPEPATLPEPLPELMAKPMVEFTAELVPEVVVEPGPAPAPAPEPVAEAAPAAPIESLTGAPETPGPALAGPTRAGEIPPPDLEAPVQPQRPRRWRNPERQARHPAEGFGTDTGASTGTDTGAVMASGLGPALAAALAPVAPEQAFSSTPLADRRAADLLSEDAPTADPGPLAGGDAPAAKDLDPDVPADSRPAADTPSLSDLIAEMTAPRPAAGAAEVPRMTTQAEPAAQPAAVPETDPAATPEAEPMVKPASAPAAEAAPSPAPSPADEAEAPAFQPPPGLRLRRRPATPSALEVLRDEAARESARRQGRAAAATLETQPELGLPAPDGRRGPIAPAFAAALDAAAAPDRPQDGLPAALRGTPAAAAIKALATLQAGPADDITPNAPPRTPRRDLLPDVEEINSTLRATSERGDEPAARDAPETLRRKRGSFRLGFGLPLCAALMMVALYVGAPRIGQMVPPLAPAMMGYADRVDAARLWIDGLVSGQPAPPAPSSQG